MPDHQWPDPLRVAVIGAGAMGARHAAAVRTTPGVVLSAVVDRHEERAVALAEGSGALACTAVDAIVGEVDLAVVAVPPAEHLEVANRLAVAGCHLLVEKPLAPTPAEARAIVRAAARAGIVLAVGHVERFNPAFMTLPGAVDGPSSVIAERSGPGLTAGPIDMVLDLMIHDIDLVASLVGPSAELVQVCGWTDRRETVARLLLSDGSQACLRTSVGASTRSRWLQVSGVAGHVVADLLGRQVHRVAADLGSRESIGVSAVDALQGQLADVVRAIRESGIPKVTGSDGVRAVEWAAAVIASLEHRPAHLIRAQMICDWGAPGTFGLAR